MFPIHAPTLSSLQCDINQSQRMEGIQTFDSLKNMDYRPHPGRKRVGVNPVDDG
jgi:hypothetical protein